MREEYLNRKSENACSNMFQKLADTVLNYRFRSSPNLQEFVGGEGRGGRIQNNINTTSILKVGS